MTNHRNRIVQIILLFLVQILLSQSLKHTFTVKHDGRHFIGPIGTPFGFNANGVYKLQVSNFYLQMGVSSKNSKEKNAINDSSYSYGDLEGLIYPGFLLKRFDSDQDFSKFKDPILDDPNICGFQDFLQEDFEIPFTYDDNDDDEYSHISQGPGVIDGGSDGIFLSMRNVQDMWKPQTPTLQHFFHPHEAGYYVLFYQICVLDPKKAQQKLMFQHITSTFQLDFQHTNIDMFGNVSYLTAGDIILPHLFLYFSISYAILLFLWYRLLYKPSHSTIYAIHHLMTVVLALKTASIFFESIRYHYIRIHGHAELWSFVYYFLNFVKGAFLFTVILLIGSGWSFFQPVLGKKQSKFILAVLLLQIMNHIALAILTHETMGEQWYNQWSNVLHIVDIISCGAILIPIVWQVHALEEQKENANQNGEIHDIQSKLSIFRSFYILVVAYIYYTRIVVYIVSSTLTYKYTWIQDLMTELGTLLFYVSVGMKFAPNVLHETKYGPIQWKEDTHDPITNDPASDTTSIELSQL